jgi:hypothetical protein
MMPTRP